MNITGVIFDLDGVIVSTDKYHYQSWKMIADNNNLVFNEKINNKLRGVSRKESLLTILKVNNVTLEEEKINELLKLKNDIYIRSLDNLSVSDIMPGIIKLISYLELNNIKMAIGSSSSNAKLILDKIELLNTFDVIVDGTDVVNSKPDPEIFLLAAKRLKLKPNSCLVIEDANSGVDAALKASMKVVGVGFASKYNKATYQYTNILDVIKLINK